VIVSQQSPVERRLGLCKGEAGGILAQMGHTAAVVISLRGHRAGGAGGRSQLGWDHWKWCCRNSGYLHSEYAFMRQMDFKFSD
jgi:hypothetical protein